MKKLFSFVLMLAAFAASAQTYDLASPSGEVKVSVKVSNGDVNGLEYSVGYGEEKILLPSSIGLEFKDMPLSYKVCNVERRSIDQVHTAIVPVKFRTVAEKCNELKIDFKGDWSVVFRAYDDGVAYRFETSFKNDEVYVADEIAEYVFAEDNDVYWANEKSPEFITHCEAFFKEIKLSQIVKEQYAYLPVSMKTSKGTRAVITEADMFDYPNMLLFGGDGQKLTSEYPQVLLSYDMRTDRDVTVTEKADYIAKTKGTRTYPWRIVTLGDDRSLLENNLSWVLSSKEYSDDLEWLRPGKISWEWWAMLNVYGVDFKAGVNTDTYKYYVDFAADYGLEYILMDEGWSASTLNVVEPNPELDLAEIIRYADSKGVGVVLWTLWTPMIKDMENILDTYRDWGVKGIKIDFMQMNDQNMVNFYEDVARECFERHLLVDYHGAFKPAGLQRKYPNAMTYEGVYGMEHDKCSYDISPEHDLVLPFTRMVAGPMDYTPGATINGSKTDFRERWEHPMSQGTRAHQAAIFVAFESPLMMMCDSPSNYRRNEEYARFLASIPTVWDETIGIDAKAGDYLLMARRNGDTWYVAGLNDWNGRDLEVTLDFLGEGEYDAQIFMDGVNANRWGEDYKLEKTKVSKGDVLPVRMADGGGWVAILKPVKKSVQNVVYTDASAFPLYGQVSDQTNSRYERLPSELQSVSREPVWYLGRHSAGLFIRFRSNSTAIHVKWESTFNNTMTHMTDTGTKGLDLYTLYDGEWTHVCSAQPQGKKSERTFIKNMDPVEREYMLYLSLYDGVSSLEIGVDEGALLAPPAVDRPSREKPIVMYGTSILQGGCANRPGMAHTNIIGRRLDREVFNLGFSGNALLDMEIAHLMASVEDPGLFILDYAPNAWDYLIDEKGEEFFRVIRDAHPDVPVIFIEDVIFPHSRFDKRILQEVTKKNNAQKRLFEKLQAAGEKNIYYISAEGMIGDDAEATVDGTHFTDLGMMRYVEHVMPTILEALK